MLKRNLALAAAKKIETGVPVLSPKVSRSRVIQLEDTGKSTKEDYDEHEHEDEEEPVCGCVPVIGEPALQATHTMVATGAPVSKQRSSSLRCELKTRVTLNDT